VAPGASTTFTVALNPVAAGFRRAFVHIATNVPGKKSFDIQFFGNGVPAPSPEIRVLGPKLGGLADGGTLKNFGKALTNGKGILKTFTIRNSGKADLTGISVTLTGMNPTDFQVTGPSVTSLAAGGETSFTVLFKPSSSGYRRASLHILSNDSDESSFDIPLIGTGIAPAPEIVIQQPVGTNRGDGRSKITFDPVMVGKTGIARLFTIKNTGTADLTGLAVSISGMQKADFVVGSLAKTRLAPGESTSFNITFKPKKAGMRNAVIHVSNNDADENPYDIKLTGTATAP
jgi:hypothetical protein